MDQERVAMKIVDVSKMTGELLLKALYYSLESGSQRITNHFENKTFKDKTNWNKFMETKETKHFESFLNSEVNTKRLENYLKKYDVGFSIKDNKDGTSTIAIDAKNVKSLEESFKGVINDLTDKDKAEKLKNNLVKNPRNMTVNEKLTYYKKKIKAKNKDKHKEKAPSPKKKVVSEEKGL